MIDTYLKLVGELKLSENAISCIALAHDELAILPSFLAHYRRLGRTNFIIVDDRSTDGSRDYLLRQTDVTLYEPQQTSSYAEHKREWRRSLLDRFGHGKWCLAPDIDEHLVYRNFEERPITELVRTLEAEGAEALHCTMLDMYGDRPLSDHCFSSGVLADAFPLTDGPESYVMLPAPRRYLRKYPSPSVLVIGGMRYRLFFRPEFPLTATQAWFLRKFANIDATFNPARPRLAGAAAARWLVRGLLPKDPIVCTKLTLLKWAKGQFFSGGSHSVSRPLRISEQSGALLHFRFTRGVQGVAYNANRGQHAGGGLYYKRILDRPDVLARSPVYDCTRRYTGSKSLDWTLR